jgi:hypothetical protein
MSSHVQGLGEVEREKFGRLESELAQGKQVSLKNREFLGWRQFSTSGKIDPPMRDACVM